MEESFQSHFTRSLLGLCLIFRMGSIYLASRIFRAGLPTQSLSSLKYACGAVEGLHIHRFVRHLLRQTCHAGTSNKQMVEFPLDDAEGDASCSSMLATEKLE